MILFHWFQVKLRFKSWLFWKEEYKENPVEQGKESTTGLTQMKCHALKLDPGWILLLLILAFQIICQFKFKRCKGEQWHWRQMRDLLATFVWFHSQLTLLCWRVKVNPSSQQGDGTLTTVVLRLPLQMIQLLKVGMWGQWGKFAFLNLAIFFSHSVPVLLP